MNYAIIDEQNIVINIAVWDGVTPWDPGSELNIKKVPDDTPVDIGWSFINGVFSPPADPVEP